MTTSSDESMSSEAGDSPVPQAAAERNSAEVDPLQEERRLTQANLTKTRSRVRKLQERFAHWQTAGSSLKSGQASGSPAYLLRKLRAAEERESKHAHKLKYSEAALAANAHMANYGLGEARYLSVEDYEVRAKSMMKAAEDDWKANMQDIWGSKVQNGVDISASQGTIQLGSEDRLYEYVPHNLVVAIRHADATLTDVNLDTLSRMSSDDYAIFRSTEKDAAEGHMLGTIVISTLEEEKKHSARAKPTTGSSGRGVLSE